MKTHVCLASGQILPNVLPVLLEKPHRVILLVSPEMQTQAERMRKIFQDRAIQVRSYEIPAYGFADTLEVCDAVIRDYPDDELTLNVTGSTKIVALAAYQQFYCSSRRIIYMDTEHHELLELGEPPRALPVTRNLLDVKTGLACYGKHFDEAQSRDKGTVARKRKTLTGQVCRLFLNAPDLLRDCNRQLNAQDKRMPPFFLRVQIQNKVGEQLLTLLVQSGLAAPSSADQVCLQSEAVRFYLNGGWLEEYVFNVVQDWKLPETDCRLNVGFEWRNAGVRPKKGETSNELDVVFTAQNRLHLVSCKTSSLDTLKNAGKDALHELDSMKANAGGLFARAMLVSFHPLKEADFRRAGELRIAVTSGRDILRLQERLQQEWQLRN